MSDATVHKLKHKRSMAVCMGSSEHAKQLEMPAGRGWNRLRGEVVELSKEWMTGAMQIELVRQHIEVSKVEHVGVGSNCVCSKSVESVVWMRP